MNRHRIVTEVKMQEKSRQQTTKQKSVLREWIEFILTVFVLAFFIRSFIVAAFRIPSGSMEDTLLVGDFLLANKIVYGPKIPFTDWRIPGIRDPKPGDIVIFKYPVNPKKDFIKRVIAVEGQTLEIRDKVVYVDSVEVPMPKHGKYIDTRRVLPKFLSPRDNFGPVTVPEDMLFVMGDNRDNSRDSRYWGWLPKKNVKGKAMFLYWSWNSYPPLWDVVHKIRWNRIGDIIR